jgi:hypothetical protein
MNSEINTLNNLYDICDAEFNSSQEVHCSFLRARGAASWARYYLLRKVQDIAQRDGMMCSYHIAHIIATDLSKIWFAHK